MGNRSFLRLTTNLSWVLRGKFLWAYLYLNTMTAKVETILSARLFRQEFKYWLGYAYCLTVIKVKCKNLPKFYKNDSRIQPYLEV